MRQAEAGGFEMYEWLCTSDEVTRPAHEAMNGKICRYDDGSVYSDDGGKTWKKRTGAMFHGMVGTDYNCRCVGVVYVPDLYQDKPAQKEPDDPQKKAENAAWEASRKRNQAAAQKRHAGRSQADIDDIRMKLFTRDMPADMTDADKKLMAKNWLEIEKQIGVTKGRPMSVEEADKQNANPNHNTITEYKGFKPIKPYNINCQTCAPAYSLRLHGFDFKATANTPGSLNEWISQSHSFDIWKNPDGTKAIPVLYDDWLLSKKYKKMTPKRYTEFFEENTKEKGVYVVTIAWKKGGAHATILQRFDDGKLAYIEPQAYRGIVKQDYVKKLSNEGTTGWATYKRGIMRIDNKIFDTKYLSIFTK